ncbi:MarR family winged helix-turn-helix transcriptional regulator [Nocardioides deserti]|uniref:Winged helix-turn-helix transcriptional regulator n=1 Tax=Nocardioides deserti TaxID=1588644 RepID=A0ABR6U9B9_9ACTN|nr:MarR family winged helix-turn-helix transcriptional regulator [Nocardioides deserti]MBC2961049.1 winged helix-turn-helix transcriptional regulator [Nocardioides deserti]GGO76213.1 MarR family transcriptional regulator [Nocardioides deserti]
MADTRTTAGLDDEELQTWAALATLLEWLPAALDAQLQQDAGLTHFEYGILFALADAPDHTLRMSTLAAYANSSLSRLSRAVSRLESRDWITRAPDPDDGRYTLATLTAAGVTKVDHATPGHVQLVRRLVLGPLTQPQAKQLREISGRIMRGIRPEDGWTRAAGAGGKDPQRTT